MKKLGFLLVALSMVGYVVGCGGGGDTPSDPPATETTPEDGGDGDAAPEGDDDAAPESGDEG